MPHLRVHPEMFVHELAKIFCSDWLEFSAFCSEVSVSLVFFLQLAGLLCCGEPCFLISAGMHKPSCAC